MRTFKLLLAQFPIFFSGAVTHASLIIALLCINVSKDSIYILFVLAGLWGMADAIWQTQINGKLLC